MKKDKPEGFETTEYAGEESIYDKFVEIKQHIEYMNKSSPSIAFKAEMHGDMLKLCYHTYESLAQTRMKEIERGADEAFKFLLKDLKKNVKKLTFKEKKEFASYSIQKVSLNGRYYVVFWRLYEMKL